MSKKHIFLSYCRENAAKVSLLRDALIQAGEPVWWDQDILPGQDWQLEIKKAMKEAYAVVSCLSLETQQRFQSGVYPELRDAIKQLRQMDAGSMFLYPVRLSQCELPKLEIDDTRSFSDLQYLDIFGPDKAQAIQKLVAALQQATLRP